MPTTVVRLSITTIIAIIALIAIIIATGCTGGSEVKLCANKNHDACGNLKIPIGKWQDMATATGNNRWKVRFYIFSTELLTLLLTLVLVVFHVSGTLRKRTTDVGILGLCLLLSIINAGLETWYASGDAIYGLTSLGMGNYMMGSWAAAAAFLWLAVIMYAVDLFFANKA